MIRPWLLLARRRSLLSLALCLVLACFTHMWASAEYPTDFGIFWHHFCGCPPDPDDARVLLNCFFLLTFFTALIFGPSIGNTMAAPGVGPTQLTGSTRFLLTRPISRTRALLAPLLVGAIAIALLPLAAIALLLGWLALVHAPSLGHLLALVRLLPAVAALGEHPTLLQILTASQLPQRYLAAVSVALCAFVLFASQRWLLLSANRKLRVLGLFPLAICLVPLVTLFTPGAAHLLFLTPAHGAPLSQLPTPLAITVHFAFAAAIVLLCWRQLTTLEL